MSAKQNDGWMWWAGTSEERVQFGPFNTRAEAISAAQNDAGGEFLDDDGVWKVSIWLCEATNPPLRLADWISGSLLDDAADRLYDSDRVSEDDDDHLFEVTPDQERDLIATINRACDEWQARHGLVFTCSTFADVRNCEHIIVSHPRDENGDPACAPKEG